MTVYLHDLLLKWRKISSMLEGDCTRLTLHIVIEPERLLALSCHHRINGSYAFIFNVCSELLQKGNTSCCPNAWGVQDCWAFSGCVMWPVMSPAECRAWEPPGRGQQKKGAAFLCSPGWQTRWQLLSLLPYKIWAELREEKSNL